MERREKERWSREISRGGVCGVGSDGKLRYQLRDRSNNELDGFNA